MQAGEVTLKGTVDSRQTKRRAEDLGRHLRGSASPNQLRVRSGSETESASSSSQTSGGSGSMGPLAAGKPRPGAQEAKRIPARKLDLDGRKSAMESRVVILLTAVAIVAAMVAPALAQSTGTGSAPKTGSGWVWSRPRAAHKAKRRPDMPTLSGDEASTSSKQSRLSGRRTRLTAPGGIWSRFPASSPATSCP